MWFLIGLLVGTSLSSGEQHGGAPALGQIPLRCYHALERGEGEYKRCRRPSLMGELNGATTFAPGQSGACYYVWRGRARDYGIAESIASTCDVDWHLDTEIAALKELNRIARERHGKSHSDAR